MQLGSRLFKEKLFLDSLLVPLPFGLNSDFLLKALGFYQLSYRLLRSLECRTKTPENKWKLVSISSRGAYRCCWSLAKIRAYGGLVVDHLEQQAWKCLCQRKSCELPAMLFGFQLPTELIRTEQFSLRTERFHIELNIFV